MKTYNDEKILNVSCLEEIFNCDKSPLKSHDHFKKKIQAHDLIVNEIFL